MTLAEFIPKEREFITTDELASILKCSKSFINKLRRNSEIPYYKIGASVRFDKHEVLNAICRKYEEICF